MQISHLEKDEWEGGVFWAKAQKDENIRNSKKTVGHGSENEEFHTTTF